MGIEGDQLVRVFERFYKTDVSRTGTGTGLGLTIAKRNIELTGGSIEVASAKGAGTTVTITLPVA